MLFLLLTEMDGFSGEQDDRPVFVLATTNFLVDAVEQFWIQHWCGASRAVELDYTRNVQA